MSNFLRDMAPIVGLAVVPVAKAGAAPAAIQPRMIRPSMMVPPVHGRMPAAMMGMMGPMRGMLPFVPLNTGLAGGIRGAGYPGLGAMYNPYAGHMMMLSGYSYGGGGSYGGGNQGPSYGYANLYLPSGVSLAPYGQPETAASGAAAILENFGVLTQDGKPAWPLGLRILAPASEARALRRRVNALLENASAQAGGAAGQGAACEAGRAVALLRALLIDQQDGMAEATFDQAARFLKKLQGALKALQRQA
jgi:hypothetical protein